MAELVWDKLGERIYETGLDKGVLYLSDGTAIPWNGLTSVIEKFDRESSSVYYDGMKINQIVSLGSFSASMKAITYPDEFVEIEGLDEFKTGVFYGDQKPKTFGLCYRTLIGNELEGDSSGYKLHIIYNLMATPTDKTYASITSDPSIVEFEWDISAIPEEVSGFCPTAHIVVDSTKVEPLLLEELEAILYGSSTVDALLIPMSELVLFISNWYRMDIVDNGDGTWSAIVNDESLITVDELERSFTISSDTIVMLDADTFEISDL